MTSTSSKGCVTSSAAREQDSEVKSASDPVPAAVAPPSQRTLWPCPLCIKLRLLQIQEYEEQEEDDDEDKEEEEQEEEEEEEQDEEEAKEEEEEEEEEKKEEEWYTPKNEAEFRELVVAASTHRSGEVYERWLRGLAIARSKSPPS